MIKKSHKFALLQGVAGILACGAAPAVAQQAEPAAPASGVQDIVVTAQKREENMQRVPIAISAVSATTLGSMQVTTLQALQGAIPNTQIENFSNTPNSAVFTIRGIGVIEPDPYAGNTVSIVVDGVPQFFSMGALLDMYDVNRVEVLRGPQGTLFGANTTGGVVNVSTAKPTGKFGGYIKANVGEWKRFDVSGAVELPLAADKLSLKIAGIHTQREGWVTNVFDGKSMGDKNINAIRGTLYFTPSADLDATLQGEYVAARNGAPVVVNGGQTGEADAVPAGTYWNGSALPQYTSPCATVGVPCVAPDKYYSGNNEVPDQSDMDTYFTALTVNARNTAIGDITSITGYKKFKLFEYTDQDGTAKTNNATRRQTKAWQFSQELRTSIDVNDRINAILGAFYMKTHYDHYQMYHLDFASPGLVQFNTQSQGTESFSVFAQTYTRITDKLKFNAGVRYTHDKIDARSTLDYGVGAPALTSPNFSVIPNIVIPGVFTQVGRDLANSPHDIDTGGKKSWNNVGWKVGLDYQIGTHQLVYASWARGFKSGGFTGRIGVLQDGNAPYNPEKVDTFEVGIKADLLNRRLRANLTTFYTNYRDMQVAQIYFDSATNVQGNRILNAAQSTIKGVELEVTAVPVDGLTFTGSVGYLDAKYKEFLYFDPVSATYTQLKGYALQNAPKWSTNLGVNYVLSMPGGAQVVFDASWRYQSKKFYTAILDTPRSQVQPTYLTDASITFRPSGKAFELTLWGKNLFDKRYISSVYDSPGYMGLVAYAPPREWGVSAKYKF